MDYKVSKEWESHSQDKGTKDCPNLVHCLKLIIDQIAPDGIDSLFVHVDPDEFKALIRQTPRTGKPLEPYFVYTTDGHQIRITTSRPLLIDTDIPKTW